MAPAADSATKAIKVRSGLGYTICVVPESRLPR